MWFAVATRPRLENVARSNLERQDYKVLLPSVRLRRRQRGRWRSVLEPMFPGYLFVALNLDKDNFASIRSTVGCIGLVRFGGDPPAIPESVICPLLELKDSPVDFNMRLSAGETVRLEDGPLEGMEAIYTKSKGGDRVEILLELLGRKQTITTSREKLSKVD